MNVEEKLRKVFEDPKLKKVCVDILIKNNKVDDHKIISLGDRSEANVKLTINVEKEVISCFEDNGKASNDIVLKLPSVGNEFNVIMHILKQWLYAHAGIKLDYKLK